jgi:Tol biopolymer transport system component
MAGIFRDLVISQDGSRIAASKLEGSLNLTQLRLSVGGGTPDGREDRLTPGLGLDRNPAYSPDSKRIAFASSRYGKKDIWILNLETRKQERLGLREEDEGADYPRWSPSGDALVVTRALSGGMLRFWWQALDGSQSYWLGSPMDRLSGGRFLDDGSLLSSAWTGGFQQVFKFDLASQEYEQLTFSENDKSRPIRSPDEKWLVFSSNATGHFQLYRTPFEAGGEEVPLTRGADRIIHSFFSPEGDWLYLQPDHQNIYRIPFPTGGDREAVTTFPVSGLFLEEPTISADGHHLAYCRSNGSSSLWMFTILNGK